MKKQHIILMAGNATRLSPLSYILPKGLLTINQKPACFNMIVDLIRGGEFDNITFVVSPSNENIVKEFATKSFSEIKMNFVVQTNPQGPLQAFQLCRDYISKPTLLLLGDTLCKVDLDYSYDWLGYKMIDDNSHSRWCLIKTNASEDIIEIIDKPEYTPETNKVLIGLYYFTNPDVLKELLACQYSKVRGELQLSSLIELYNKEIPMKGMRIDSWHDTGTLKDYNQTLARNISGRSFNTFKLDEFGVLTKQSNYLKLKSEIEWLEKIKDMGLGYMTPGYYGAETKIVNGQEIVSYKTEYVNGSTLTEYFNYYKICQENWKYIFHKLLNFGNNLWKNKAPKDFDIKKHCKYIYIDKTLERIAKWNRKDILEKDYIIANGEKLIGFYKIFDLIKPLIDKLILSSPKYASIIHGDSFFSNIIFFPQAGTFKYIDPRGNFGIDTIYGDMRYDVAKFRHNYHGLYDYITLNMFSLSEIACDNFEYAYFTDEILPPNIFDEIISNFHDEKFDIDEIELIEGLLFISMVPLHDDNNEAQILYYIVGLKCLNNQYKKMENKQ